MLVTDESTGGAISIKDSPCWVWVEIFCLKNQSWSRVFQLNIFLWENADCENQNIFVGVFDFVGIVGLNIEVIEFSCYVIEVETKYINHLKTMYFDKVIS